MNQEREPSMEDILRNVEKAEVVCVIFPLLGQCLVYDNRHSEEDPPQVNVSPPLGSAERRLRQLNQARPHLSRTHKMTAVPWTGSVASMARSGIWERIVRRMEDAGFERAQASCQSALDELLEWEYRANVEMIRGQGPFHTVWSRAGAE